MAPPTSQSPPNDRSGVKAAADEDQAVRVKPVSASLSYWVAEDKTATAVPPCDAYRFACGYGTHFTMPSRRNTVSVPEMLPPCEGPKLKLFEHHKSPIQWLERLDVDRDEEAVSEGYVFRARINGRDYAIKVFKFFDPLTTKFYWGPLIGRDTPLDTASYYTDPFYAECRAYGRIQQLVESKKMRSNIAVPCHGFIFLQDEDERFLDRYDLDFELDKVDLHYQRKTVGGCRVRAIVKDIASPHSGVTQRDLYRVLSGIKLLNKNKIYNRDIRLENYRDSQIVDFGSSWTEPHSLLEALDERAALGSRHADRVRFDRMIQTENIPNPRGIRATPDLKYVKRLRPRKQPTS